MTQTISDMIRLGRRDLEARCEQPRLEAELLLAEALGISRAQLYAHSDQPVARDEKALFMDFVTRRADGVPLAYLTGEKEFWSLTFKVSAATLVPRPETELLVELALGLASSAARIADLGTGSGAIAIAVANERPGATVVATDVCEDALEVAGENATCNGLSNIDFRLAQPDDWFAAIADDQFELIVSNPPYVCADDPLLTTTDLRFEPRAALAAGEDGLLALRQIISGAVRYLSEGGWLAVEHGATQGQAVRDLFSKASFENIKTHLDLAGHERVTLGQLSPLHS